MGLLDEALVALDQFKRRAGRVAANPWEEFLARTGPEFGGSRSVVDTGLLSAIPEVREQSAAGLLDSPQGQAALGLVSGPVKAKRLKSGESKGDYVGTKGFGGISPQKAAALRANFIEDAKAGAEASKYWYDESSGALHRIAGHDDTAADTLANVVGTLSSSSPVQHNTGWAARSWNQNLVGDPIYAGLYPNMNKPVLKGIYEGTGNTTGLKRTPFKEGLSVEWSGLSPEELAKIRPTNDIHQASVLTGQKIRKGLSPAQHAYLDSQMGPVVKTLNTDAQKAISEARAAGATDEQIAKMDQPDWTAYRAQSAAWPVQRYKHGLAPSIEAGAKNYADFLDEFSTNVTREWVPGNTTGHLAGMTPKDAVAYSKIMEDLQRGPKGNDQLAQQMGLLAETPFENLGVYGAERNPGSVTPIITGMAGGAGSGRAIDDASRRAVEAYAGAAGLLGQQKQVAYNWLGHQSPQAKMETMSFRRPGEALTPEQLRSLQDAMMARELDAPQAAQEGARAMYFGDPGKPAVAALKQAQEVGKQFGATVEPRFRHSDIFPATDAYGTAPEKFSNVPYLNAIEAGGPKMVAGFNEFAKAWAPKALEQVTAFAQAKGLQTAEWFPHLLRGLAEGGVARVRELVAQGLVPVAALAALGLSATGGGAPEGSAGAAQ